MTVGAEFRGTRCYVAWRTKPKGRLNFLSAQLEVEKHRGSLEPGKAADLVVLSANPLDTPVENLDDIQVLGTWIDGQPVDTRKASLPNLRIALRALGELAFGPKRSGE